MPTRDRLHRRLQGDDGSSLLLMPAGLLIVVLLGAIAVDLSNLQLAERRLRSLTRDAANDAVGAGVDEDALRAGGPIELDPESAEEIARLSMTVHWPETIEHGPVHVTVDTAAGTVSVTASGTVLPIFGRALPGVRDGTEVTATATAELRQR